MRKIILGVFLGLLLAAAGCTKKESVSTATELLSFGPSGVKHGDEIRFIGNNLNRVTAIRLPGITVEASAFTQHSNETITLLVPDAATSGKVFLVTAEGEIESKGTINFEVPVVITAIPAAARPGEEITITGEFLNWVESVTFADGVVQTQFVSQSLNELKLVVPMMAQTGTLVFYSGGAEPLTIETDSVLSVAVPLVTGIAPNPADRGQEITLTGTDLDLTYGILFKGVSDTIKTFTSKTATEIKLVLPDRANKGPIGIVAPSLLVNESEAALLINGDLPPLEPLAFTIYGDALQNGWQKWGGWGGGSSDLNSNENVRDGERSVKAIFQNDWGASLQMGGGNTALSGYTQLVFALYGEPGTAGQEVEVLVNSTLNYSVPVTEGEWTEITIPLSAFSNPASLNELSFRAKGWAGTVFIDHIGLR